MIRAKRYEDSHGIHFFLWREDMPVLHVMFGNDPKHRHVNTISWDPWDDPPKGKDLTPCDPAEALAAAQIVIQEFKLKETEILL